MTNIERIIKTPHLPQYEVNTVIIGEGYPEVSLELAFYGKKTLTISENTALSSEVSCHADMLICQLNENEFLLSQNDSKILNAINAFGAKASVITTPLDSEYPADVRLNTAILGKRIIGRIKSLAPEIIDFADIGGYELININQGYTKCSMCIVNDNAVITEDRGIAYLLKKYQIDVLEIESGFVELSEAHTGFLGGASGKLSAGEMYFNGNLANHPDYSAIKQFLYKHSVEPVFTNARELTDIGGILPLTEISV